MTATTSIPRQPRPRDHLLGALVRVLLLVVSPHAQLAAFGAIAAYAGSTEPAWSILSIVGWAAGAIALAAIVRLAATGRGGTDAMLPTNASALDLSLVQLAALVILWRQTAPDSLLGLGVIVAFAVLSAIDLVERAAFVLRVRRIGVEGEARRIVARIEREHPDDVHEFIAAATVGRRDRSRLHWRLGEALSAENVAIYERERAATGATA